MKLKEMPEDMLIDSIRLKLPPKALKEFKSHGGGENLMYFAGSGFGGVWMSPDPPGGQRRLYPFPDTIHPTELMDWEVAP